MGFVAAFILALTLSACLNADLVPCGDLSCRAGSVCTVGGCATPEDAAACAEHVDGDACMTSTSADGTCSGGSCHAVACGNGILDHGEVCDDGNQTAGDGCSADCRSNETCGNAIVDGVGSEQCDDGNRVSGDGCSSACQIEFESWVAMAPLDLARASHAMTYDSTATRIVLFGGVGTSGEFLSDTWTWDGSSWIAQQPATSPSPRSQVALAYDSTRHRVVLFGGADASRVNGDTWEWDGVIWTQRTLSPSPSPRRDARMADDPVHHQVVLFGGEDSAGTMLGDTWVWDGATWTLAATTGPSPRKASPMTWDATNGVVLLESGTASESTADSDSVWITDTWAWNGSAWMQTHGPTGGQQSNPVVAYYPELGAVVMCVDGQGGSVSLESWSSIGWDFTLNYAESGPWVPQLEYDGRQLVRFGGLLTGAPSAATYLGYDNHSGVDGDKMTWDLIAPPSPPPDGQSGAAMFYDERRGVMVLVGGTNAMGNTNDTWEWNRVQWFPYGAAPGGSRAAIAYDSARGVAVLYGGSNGGPLGATWERAGTAWSQISISGSTPGPRSGHAMAFDRASGKTILFGGLGSGGTWAYDGAWTQVVAATDSPPDRTGAAMAYDDARHTIVVFGGIDGTQKRLDDLWEFDGTTWTQRFPALSPAARERATMLYDPRRHRLVMFGGATATGVEHDVWEWDGTAWSARNASELPPSRYGAAAAYDAIHGELVLFGGVNVLGAQLGDLWSIGFRSSQNPQDQCEGIDTDGDGLIGCADPDCAARCTPDCAFGDVCNPALPHCGDGTCSALEDYRLCPSDCAPP